MINIMITFLYQVRPSNMAALASQKSVVRYVVS